VELHAVAIDHDRVRVAGREAAECVVDQAEAADHVFRDPYDRFLSLMCFSIVAVLESGR
jgi:hypothetical protein